MLYLRTNINISNVFHEDFMSKSNDSGQSRTAGDPAWSYPGGGGGVQRFGPGGFPDGRSWRKCRGRCISKRGRFK